MLVLDKIVYEDRDIRIKLSIWYKRGEVGVNNIKVHSIGEAIAYCRKDKKWSQQFLGNKFKPSKSVSEISRWERNEVQPSAKHMTELLGIFGSSFQGLITTIHSQTSRAKLG